MFRRTNTGPIRKQGRGFQSAYPNSWSAKLLAVAKVLKLHEDERWKTRIEKVLLSQNEKAAEKMVKKLSRGFNEQLLSPNHFITFADNLDGDILIGYLEDGRKVGIDLYQFTHHIGLFGASGSGKTEGVKHITRQLKKKGVPVIKIDRKNDFSPLVKEGVDVVHWSQFRFNFLRPPALGINLLEYRNDASKLLADISGSQQLGTANIGLALHQTYERFDSYRHWQQGDEDKAFPTLHDVLKTMTSSPFLRQLRYKARDSVYSFVQKISSYIVELDPIISVQKGFDLIKLYKQGRTLSINVDGISLDQQNLLVGFLLLQFYHYFKTFGPRNTLNIVFVIPEAKAIYGERSESNFIVSDLTSKIREFGMGLIVDEQVPSKLSQYLLSNLGTLLMFRQADAVDLSRLQQSSGATYAQSMDNFSLQPGECIARLEKSKDLLKIKVPYQPEEKFIPQDEVTRLMTSRLDELNSDVIPCDKEKNQAQGRQKEAAQELLTEQEWAFLKAVAHDFDRPASKIYAESGLSSSAGFRIKEKLRKRKYITTVSTNLGKGGKKAQYLIPDVLVFEKLGISLGEGRGKALHKHYQEKLKTIAEHMGYEAIIEHAPKGTPEAADVGVVKRHVKIAIEVAITSKPSQEVFHIEKNLRLGFDVVILSFVNRRVMEKTKQLATEKYTEEELQNVHFCLVNEVQNILVAC